MAQQLQLPYIDLGHQRINAEVALFCFVSSTTDVARDQR